MKPLEIPPGVFYAPTESSSSGNYREANLIRWVSKRMQPIKGWEKYAFPVFPSPVRRIHPWVSNNGNQYVGYLCERHVFVDLGGGDLYDITPVGGIVAPSMDYVYGGYGESKYGTGTYGTHRDPVNKVRKVVPCYTLGNWGQQLLAMTSPDGRLLFWDPDYPTSKAVVVPGAPVNNRSFVVTPERHVMLFGMSASNRTFGWSDEENYSNWNFADVASKAGNYDIEPASPIISEVLTEYGVVMFSVNKAYIIKSIGLPYVYNYTEIGESISPISPASLCNTSNGPLWVSEAGFWTYNGSSVVPLDCPVWTWVQEDINVPITSFVSFMVNLSLVNEVWWFFSSISTDALCDKYVVYNYKEGWWSTGKLARSAAASDGMYPIMADTDKVYKHEIGYKYPGAELPWIETHVLNVDSGSSMFTLQYIIPDIKGEKSRVGFKVYVKDDRSGGVEKLKGPFMVNGSGKVNPRCTGRDMRIRVESYDGVGAWTMGQNLVQVSPRGEQ